MKKMLLCMFIVVDCALAYVRWGLPYTIDISTYAVNDYSHYTNGTSNLSRSIRHKSRFVSQMMSSINSRYPNISVNHVIDRTDSTATTFNFVNDANHNSEIVFFSGHGNVGLVALYDGITNLGTSKKFESFNRWVFLDACLVLDTTEAYATTWFNGAHAVLSFKSLSYEFVKPYNCFINCDHHRSEDTFNYFADYFIEDGSEIWDAYNRAVRKAIYSNGNLGIEPGIMYVEGTAENGQFVDFSEERFQNVYNGPLPPSAGRVKRKTQPHGTPAY